MLSKMAISTAKSIVASNVIAESLSRNHCSKKARILQAFYNVSLAAMMTKVKPGEDVLTPLIEEEEFAIDKNISKMLTGDGQEVSELLRAKFPQGKMEGPFKRLYDAAQMKVLANTEFEKAKEEMLQHMKVNKVTANRKRKRIKNDHNNLSKGETTVKSNTLSTTNTFCNTEAQRAESCVKEGKRTHINGNINNIAKRIAGMSEHRKRSVSNIKSHYDAE